MSQYFPEPKSLTGRVKVELDFPNYSRKVDLKNATGVDTSPFAKKMIQVASNLMQINQMLIN